MAHDPTAWPTPMHAWRHYKSLAERCEKAMYEIRGAYEREHGASLSTDRKIGEDLFYQKEAGDHQWAVAQAAMYADAAQMRLLEAILAELRRVNNQPSRGV